MEIIREAAQTSQKIDGSAFLYLPPKSPADEFAQCGTCTLFKPDSKRCGIFSPKDKVTADQSCGFYLHGTPTEDQECKSIVTPDQAGLVTGSVRCENCSWFDGKCGLYKMLNEKLPDDFNLDPDVDPKGCCNAFTK